MLTKSLGDLIPFLMYKKLWFTSLNITGRKLREVMVPVTAVESLTKTLVKFDISKARKGEVESLNSAETELRELVSDWNKGEWAEVDWSKVKDLSLLEIVESRKNALEQARAYACARCPRLLNHV